MFGWRLHFHVKSHQSSPWNRSWDHTSVPKSPSSATPATPSLLLLLPTTVVLPSSLLVEEWRELSPVSESSPATEEEFFPLNLLAEGITWYFLAALPLAVLKEGSSLVSRRSVSSGSPLDTPDVLPSSAGLPEVESRNLSSISTVHSALATSPSWSSPRCRSCSSLSSV